MAAPKRGAGPGLPPASPPLGKIQRMHTPFASRKRVEQLNVLQDMRTSPSTLEAIATLNYSTRGRRA